MLFFFLLLVFDVSACGEYSRECNDFQQILFIGGYGGDFVKRRFDALHDQEADPADSGAVSDLRADGESEFSGAVSVGISGRAGNPWKQHESSFRYAAGDDWRASRSQ